MTAAEMMALVDEHAGFPNYSTHSRTARAALKEEFERWERLERVARDEAPNAFLFGFDRGYAKGFSEGEKVRLTREEALEKNKAIGAALSTAFRALGAQE